MSKDVIALLRVSGAAQAAADREGLPVQREDCEALARAHGLSIVEWVTLEGVSGAAVLQDPRFAAMLAQLADPSIEGVVVGAFDRLFRRGRFADYVILDAFADSKTVLYTPQGVYDLTADSDALLGVIHSELSAAERRNIARRTRAGRERKRRERGVRAEGAVGMPRGVRYSKAEGWAYVWPEAERVREVFRHFLSGTTNMAAIARLTGLDAGKGSPSWAIRSILKQPLYRGIYRVDRRWVNGQAIPRAPGECYEHRVLDPPLVSDSDWHRAQALLSQIKGSRPRLPDRVDRPLDYLGHSYCIGCGAPLSSRKERSTLRETWSYVCARSYRRSYETRRCEAFGQLSGDVVDPYLDAMLERVLGDPDTLRALIEARLGEEPGNLAEMREAEVGLAKLANQRERARDLYEMGEIDARDLRKRIARIEGDMTALRAIQAREEPPEVDEQVVDDVALCFASWTSLRPAERRELLAAYQIRIGLRREGERKRASPVVDWVEIGVVDGCRMDVGSYKKLKRLGIG